MTFPPSLLQSPRVDLLVRTSGEHRLSDFLTWEASNALLYFTPVLWPDLSLWDMLHATRAYQRARRKSLARRAAAAGGDRG